MDSRFILQVAGNFSCHYAMSTPITNAIAVRILAMRYSDTRISIAKSISSLARNNQYAAWYKRQQFVRLPPCAD